MTKAELEKQLEEQKKIIDKQRITRLRQKKSRK